MSTPPTIPSPASSPTTASNPTQSLADVYTFQWSALTVQLPLVSTVAVALCLLTGILAGHPGGALVASGGAFTIAFGANQRISDSRLLPMLFAVFGMASAGLAGTLAGHSGGWLILTSALSAAIYGVLTIRHAGMAWVGQQAAVALFVASAFPSNLHGALVRAGLIVAGGMTQVLVISLGLRLMPELRDNLWAIPRSQLASLYEQRAELLNRLYALPATLPATDRKLAAIYAVRLVLTVTLASEVYRRLGIQSGYWIPMTALLVQRPEVYETLSRAITRVGGTLAGAMLATLLASHLHPGPWPLAALTTFFAFWCFATNAVNYGLFSICVTSYIVFLLALDQIPGPEIAHRRAACTAVGALIALLVHLDALRRRAKAPTEA